MRTNTNQKGKTNKRMIVMLATTLIIGLQNIYAQTELYKKYQHRKDITVACAMQFPINNDVKTNITIFVPKTKDAVYYLVEEFNLGIEKDIIDKTLGDKRVMSLFRMLVHKDDPTKSYGAINEDDDWKDVSMLAYNYNVGSLVVFHNIETEKRYDAISRYLMNVLRNPEKFPSIENKIK